MNQSSTDSKIPSSEPLRAPVFQVLPRLTPKHTSLLLMMSLFPQVNPRFCLDPGRRSRLCVATMEDLGRSRSSRFALSIPHFLGKTRWVSQCVRSPLPFFYLHAAPYPL